MDYIYGKLNYEVKKVEYVGLETSTTQTTVDNTDRTIEVDVLKVPHVLTILDKNDETTTTFDGSEDKSITLHSYNLIESDKETLPYGSFAEYTFLKDDEQEGSTVKIPNVLNTDFTITPLRPASQMFESFGSNKLNLQSSVLKTITPGPAYFSNSSGALTNGQQGFAFSTDGTKMFTVDTSTDLLYQYTLGTAWNINTLVIPATLSVPINTLDNTINGVYFKPDGTKVFMIGSSTKSIFSATLSTPWDISTLSAFSTTTGLGANKAYTSLMLSADGLKLYVGNSTDDKIDIYYLSTAWNTGPVLGSIVSSIAVSTQEGTITGFFIGNDGETLFIVGSDSDRVSQFTMSSPWGDNAVYADKFVATQQGTTTDVQFKPDGSRMFLIGTTTRRVDEYIVPSNWDLYGGQVITKEIKDSFYLRTVIDADNESSNLEVGTKGEDDVSVPLLIIDKNGNIKSKATNIDFTSSSDVLMSANGAYFNLGTDGDTYINAGNAGINLTGATGVRAQNLKIDNYTITSIDNVFNSLYLGDDITELSGQGVTITSTYAEGSSIHLTDIIEFTNSYSYSMFFADDGLSVLFDDVTTIQINDMIYAYKPIRNALYATALRPTNISLGSQIYDETLKKPIWWNGTDWTDAMGTVV